MKINSNANLLTRGPFLESSGNFSGPQSHCKISNFAITELFYSHILWREVPFVQEVSGVFTSPFLDTDENGFTSPKSFWGFRETGPWNSFHGIFSLISNIRAAIFFALRLNSLRCYELSSVSLENKRGYFRLARKKLGWRSLLHDVIWIKFDYKVLCIVSIIWTKLIKKNINFNRGICPSKIKVWTYLLAMDLNKVS